MGINGKKKGNSYEREIANEFSELFQDTFRRVPQSGAIVGGMNRDKNLTLRQDAQEILAGDIISPQWFPFSIECKNYGEKTGPNIYCLLESDDKTLDKWIEQGRGDSQFSKKEFLVMIKITRRAEYAVLDWEKFNEILKANNIEALPRSFIRYAGKNIILDKADFINNFIRFYFPEDKRQKNT
jgi:hypothetical protein